MDREGDEGGCIHWAQEGEDLWHQEEGVQGDHEQGQEEEEAQVASLPGGGNQYPSPGL